MANPGGAAECEKGGKCAFGAFERQEEGESWTFFWFCAACFFFCLGFRAYTACLFFVVWGLE